MFRLCGGQNINDLNLPLTDFFEPAIPLAVVRSIHLLVTAAIPPMQVAVARKTSGSSFRLKAVLIFAAPAEAGTTNVLVWHSRVGLRRAR